MAETRPEPYGFAPPEAVGVSSASDCTTVLNDDKRDAIKGYIGTLGPALQTEYGPSKHYSAMQIRQTALAQGLSIDYLCWAYILYCSASEFESIHAAAGEVCDYSAMHGLVAATFFNGNSAFDLGEVTAAIITGSAQLVSSGTIEAVADFDWFGLLDWS